MNLLIAGPVYGKLEEFYAKAKAERADFILQVGNLGCFPDPSLGAGRSFRSHSSGVGDFPQWYTQDKPVPVPTIFTAGRHEDHAWMERMLSKGRTELLPNLTWLVNGYATTIGTEKNSCTILSLGKVYSPNTFVEGRRNQKKRLAHYTRREVERACSVGPVDILLCHESPQTKGIDHVVYATRPRIIIHSKQRHDPKYQKYSGSISTFALSEMEILPIKWPDDLPNLF